MAEAVLDAVLGKLAGLVLKSIVQTGARRPELEPARSRYLYGDRTAEEETLNICLVGEAFLQLFITGFGFLASIWATVVLLGGFASILHKMDFWFATVIVFIQSAKIIGFNPYPEARFFSEAPQAYIELYVEPFTQAGRTRPPSDRIEKMKLFLKFLGQATFLMSNLAYAALLITIVPLAAALTCITLSIIRLVVITRKNYGGGSTEASNVKPALIFFYALVLTQGAVLFLYLTLWCLRWKVARSLRKKCGFETMGTTKLIDKYINDTRDTCIQAGVSKTIKRNLVSFAQDLLKNDSDDGRLTAVSVLLTLMEQDAHRARAISQIQSSEQSIVRLFEMLNSKSLFDKKTKAYTAMVVAKLASNVHIADIPGAIESVSSMLDSPSVKMGTQVTIVGTSLPLIRTTIGPESKPLIAHSLLILGQSACDPDNCLKIYNTKGLVSKIIALLLNGMYLATRGDDGTYIEILTESIGVLTKLVMGTGGRTSRKLREQILGNARSMKEMLTNITSEPVESKTETLLIEIITALARGEATRGNFQHMSEFLDELLRLCFGSNNSKKVAVVNELLRLFFGDNNIEEVRTAAGQALTELARGSDDNHRMIMGAEMAGGQTVLDNLGGILGTVTHVKLQTTIAQMMAHFCTKSNSEEEINNVRSLCNHFTTVLRTIIHIVTDQTTWPQVVVQQNNALNQQNEAQPWDWKLQEIIKKLRKLLEVPVHTQIDFPFKRTLLVSLLTIVAQMCDKQMVTADIFTHALTKIPFDDAEFVEKLKEIIQGNNESTGDCLEIIMATAKLSIWIMENVPIFVGHFRQKEIDKRLGDAAETLLKLEQCMLLTGSVANTANYETLSSLVGKVNRPVALPSPQP